ncbi:MAG: DUF1622 domain-containing protein [Candidatus Kapaibacterium sp.]
MLKENIKIFAEYAASFMEFIGIAIISLVTVYVIAYGIIQFIKNKDHYIAYENIRRRLGYGILLGLEILIGADIIHTVAVKFDLKTVSVLAIIVVIRTVLSFTMDVEIKGRWPWQQKDAQGSDKGMG